MGAGNGYEFIANGQPKDASCWTLSRAQVIQVNDCGVFHESDNSFDMKYGSRVSQEFKVPDDMNQTQWYLNYLLTMQDPNDDGWWNRLKATVYDVNTGRNLASQTYWGDDPDISCARRTLAFTGNLAGHTLRVIFSDGSAYSNTIVHVRGVSIIQPQF